MPLPKPLPSVEYLNACFSLDVEMGVLRWRHRDDVPRNWNTKYAGTIAGSIRTDGYIGVMVMGKIVKAHRVIFKMTTGRDPIGGLDHQYGDRRDNQPNKLREATPVQNGANANYPTGQYPRGVNPNGKGFIARMKYSGGRKSLGTFNTPELAAEAYNKKAYELHGEFAYHRRVQ